MYITKSEYKKAVHCSKRVWLDEHSLDKELKEDTLGVENGIKAGETARAYFGEYSLVDFNPDERIMKAETEELMAAGTETIAEATFVYANLLCRVDLLHDNGEGYDIIEVKSSTEIKDEHYDDVAFQYYVLTAAGIKVDNVYLMHTNGEYRRHGDLNLQELFVMEDVTDEAKKRAETVEETVVSLFEILGQDDEPECKLQPYCIKNPKCDYCEYCTRHLPKPSVLDIAGMWGSVKCKYIEKGVLTYSDIIADSTNLKPKYKLQVETELYDLPDTVNVPNITEFLDTLSYPIYHLDFETFQSAIPPFEGTRPWQQIPFQYSLHVQSEKGGPVEHYEYLGKEGTDPRRALAEQLVSEIPLNSCSLAYNMGFERGVIEKLAEMYDDLAPHLMNIHDNMHDLMIPFKNQDFYSKEFNGRYSIKVVLPTLCPNDPDLDYKNLDEIHNGSEAMAAFPRMGEGSMSSEEIAATRNNLLKYCELDTLAMVKVLEKLYEIVED